jgi:hypothetical protein
MHKMLFGVFSSVDDANAALDELYDAGFTRDEVSVVVQDAVVRERINATGEQGSAVAEGAAGGAATGGVVGGIVGLLAGIGAITIPGLGAILVGGPLAAALGLSGAAASTITGAVTGALAGGLVGALVGLGVPEEEAKAYEERVKSGDILVTVDADDEETRAKAQDILQNHDADRINYYTAA